MTDALIKELREDVVWAEKTAAELPDEDIAMASGLELVRRHSLAAIEALSAPGDAEREEILVMIDRRMEAARLLGETHISISMAWLKKIKDALLRRPVEPVVTDEMVECGVRAFYGSKSAFSESLRTAIAAGLSAQVSSRQED